MARPPASPSAMAGKGVDSPDAAASPGQDSGSDSAQSAIKGLLQEIGTAEMTMAKAAKAVPTAGKAVAQAMQAIQALKRAIISNPGTPEPKAPMVNG